MQRESTITYSDVNVGDYFILTEIFFDVFLFVLDNEAEAAAAFSLHTGVCCLSRMHPSSGESSQSACACARRSRAKNSLTRIQWDAHASQGY